MTTHRTLTSPDDIRTEFSRAMSRMYRDEVPAYGTLIEIVREVNAIAMNNGQGVTDRLATSISQHRIFEERHGAIRLGTAEELSTMRRLFAVMGMFPVGYYDLSVAGIPVHSTAFRPTGAASLKRNPFRVFTSLLRLDLIADADLRAEAQAALFGRDIFTRDTYVLIEKAERNGGLSEPDAEFLVRESLETFRWHDRALVSKDLYERLNRTHRLLADVVSFKGPHINHLTPRTLDIDRVQTLMAERNVTPKETIEGPPARKCPILLRQTSFKALDETVAFLNSDGVWQAGMHTARFGEVEQRGAALTKKGRELYDRLLERAQNACRGVTDPAQRAALHAEAFVDFPDTNEDLRAAGLAYFEYRLTEVGKRLLLNEKVSLTKLLEAGLVEFHPIVYEDFLPVSAAGIFQSNLGDEAVQHIEQSPAQKAFEEALGCPVADEFALYEAMQAASIQSCLE